MLSLRLLNAEKVHSSESIHVNLSTNGPLVEGWGGGKRCVCVWGGGGGMGCCHAEHNEKSLEGDGHYGLFLECFFIRHSSYESYNNVAPNEKYTCFMSSK